MKCNSLTAVIRDSGAKSLTSIAGTIPSQGKVFLSIKNHSEYLFKIACVMCLKFIAKHKPQVTVAA